MHPNSLPYPISERLLKTIEKAEAAVHSIDPGIRQVRVRHHGKIACIEIPPQQAALLTNEQKRENLVNSLRKLGYTYITLDLEGYQAGSMNKELNSDV